MIRAVGNKRLELSDGEFKYLCKLRERFGEGEFVGLFETDKNGMILSVNPPVDKKTSLLIFLLDSLAFYREHLKLGLLGYH